MTSLRAVIKSSGTIAAGRAKLKITWLKTSTMIGSSSRLITAIAGSMVSKRRTMTGILSPTKPSMTTWPAMVPTVEEERPEASNAMPKAVQESGPSNSTRVWWACCDRDHVNAPAEKDSGRDDDHGGVDDEGNVHRHDHVDLLVAKVLTNMVAISLRRACTSSRMKVDHVRHHGGAQHPDSNEDAFAVDDRHHGVVCHLAPVRLRQEEFDYVADTDDAYQGTDHDLHRTVAVALQAGH